MSALIKMLKEKNYYWLYMVAIAFGFLLICSRSSFLYPFNNWDDANSYFTMGKGMMTGKIIYKELFDQKGPFLYFLYGIAYLISHTDFMGVFILEILSFSLFLYSAYKIACLYIKPFTAVAIMPLLGLVVTTSKSFYWGGCAEEFCLPIISWGLFLFLRYLRYQNHHRKTMLLGGVLAGCILMIKFNIAGFYIAWAGLFVLFFLWKRQLMMAVKTVLFFLGGIFISVAPWFLYFGWNHALGDWFECYVACNVFHYSDLGQESVSLGTKIHDLILILYWLIWDNFIYFLPIIVGFIAFLFIKRIDWFEKICIYLLFGCLFVGIYIGGTTLFYYSLPLTCFAIFGLICLGFIWERFCSKRVTWMISGVLFVVALLLATKLSMNWEFSKETKEDFFLFDFAEEVMQEENPSLLNISCLDAGLFTLTGIVPEHLYFQSNMVNGYDIVANEQLRYIKEGTPTFILARYTYPEEIWDHYELVMEATYNVNGEPFGYYLFKAKSAMQ